MIGSLSSAWTNFKADRSAGKNIAVLITLLYTVYLAIVVVVAYLHLIKDPPTVSSKGFGLTLVGIAVVHLVFFVLERLYVRFGPKKYFADFYKAVAENAALVASQPDALLIERVALAIALLQLVCGWLYIESDQNDTWAGWTAAGISVALVLFCYLRMINRYSYTTDSVTPKSSRVVAYQVVERASQDGCKLLNVEV